MQRAHPVTFRVLPTSLRFLTPRVRDVESTQPCVKCTQGLTSYLVRACPVTIMSYSTMEVSEHLLHRWNDRRLLEMCLNRHIPWSTGFCHLFAERVSQRNLESMCNGATLLHNIIVTGHIPCVKLTQGWHVPDKRTQGNRGSGRQNRLRKLCLEGKVELFNNV